jgi:non-specific serine/threonine protein kinase/serine/threonine-protein kinase
MEYVQGVPITEFCNRHKLSNRERLELFMQVCEGVQHAHQKAIIHRDLKPSNVLVMTQDGKRVPKIIDFGVAKATAQKLTEKTMYTQLGVLIGTPEYMSPEQAEMTGEDVDTRTDVYSLGVMLYELLVGVLPFDPRELRSEGLEGIRKKIREEEPQTPSRRVITLGDQSTESANRRSVDRSTLQRELRGDLDWITMKSLEKDRARRYGSPSELAADVARYLHHEPVLARPPSTAYRVGKFVRRHKLGVAAGTVLVIGVGAGIVGTTVGLIQARRSEARALAEATRSERVTQLLQYMMSDVSPDRMGSLLLTDLRQQAKNSRENLGGGEGEIASVLATLEDALVGIYLADSGVRLLDEEILSPAKERIDEQFGDDLQIAGRLHHTIGEVYRTLGHHAQAVEEFEKALELRRKSLGEDHPDTLRSMLKLALVYSAVGRSDDHLRLVSDVAERGRRVLGDEHELTLDALGEVADAYMYGDDAAKVKEGEDQHFALLEVERRALGEDHRQTLYRMDKVAQILQRRGNLDGAASMFHEALENKRRALGDEDPSTLGTLFNIAVNNHMRGLYDEAESSYREMLEVGRSRFGESSNLVWIPMNNLSGICRLQGRYEEAESWARRLLEIHRRWRGEQATPTVVTMMVLADALARKGDNSEAESLYLDSLEIARRRDYSNLEAGSHLGLARLYREQGDLTRAEAHFQRSVEFQERSGNSLFGARGTAAYHVVAGDFGAALRFLRRAVELGEPRASIATDPDFAPLHGDPEFEALVTEVKKRVRGE